MPDNIIQITFLVELITALLVRLFWVGRVARSRKGRTKSKLERNSTIEMVLMFLEFLGMQVLPVIFIFTSWLSFADYSLPKFLSYIGAAVFAGAIWLLWRSHADLGKNWSGTLKIVQRQSLITGGVYRYIRHPMYATHILWGIAQMLMLPNWIAGPAFLLSFVPLYLLRASKEEEMMLQQFGDEYSEYMKRTGRLIPLIK